MYRRAFLAAGTGALLTSPAVLVPPALAEAPPRRYWTGSYVTSLDPAALREIVPGTALALRRDPLRRFEPKTAVAVFAGQRRLGYLPGSAARLVAPLLEAETVALSAEVTAVAVGARPAVALDLFIG